MKWFKDFNSSSKKMALLLLPYLPLAIVLEMNDVAIIVVGAITSLIVGKTIGSHFGK